MFFKQQSRHLIKNGERSKTRTDTKQAEDILHTADSYIETSQFDTALNYMRKKLQQNQDNEEFTIKLISLYKALSYTREFDDAYEQFADNLLTSRYWDDARQYFLDKQT